MHFYIVQAGLLLDYLELAAEAFNSELDRGSKVEVAIARS
jgi:hypothetical protein